ncbi:MAG TPA: four helix bundle protein [Candidatus Peribacter riflensis]|uniref:S23 ribosomal protein n=1 Tax=Candidatus Peribacter riflensis TaxID=1735162 RepID=A0A0S1SMD0_9BACT|nr:MAG: S23 ribosomal protein [Candidatus Peribacter riflensis]OGJ79245.1 MAG: hypothetical protein A2398_00300 [Candidatus Peribacteria bacterium RIFOXYB1_FULL_57_12]OGJ82537.1 MAG: hypothetical protein A2412_02970 [Candidatus Peribacteria bacterium RIFOXYC1_FULL_58_8]ALM10915.1 MAG: S23 ribosomal protein [Candidatus Peribacter riflensis]ALM12018.1 MAG: S23 ribosomal protein [Candidatus Peribacter riflensis]
MERDFTIFGPWQKAMALAISIHRATKEFPKDEQFGVTPQLRRAILSVAANIAEGFGRYTFADKMHKYVQARGELTEVMSFLYYCHKVDYLIENKHDELLRDCREVQRLLNALITKMDHLKALRP